MGWASDADDPYSEDPDICEEMMKEAKMIMDATMRYPVVGKDAKIIRDALITRSGTLHEDGHNAETETGTETETETKRGVPASDDDNPFLSLESAETDLEAALDDASEKRLRQTLRHICSLLPAAKASAAAYLLRPIANSSTRKRKAYETCVNCHEEYDASLNSSDACRFHDGDQDVDDDSDTWIDHDDRCHGDRYSQDLMDDATYADGYMMTCCEKRPDEEGCVMQRHVPRAGRKKQATRGSIVDRREIIVID